jgi:hypothetical protein
MTTLVGFVSVDNNGQTAFYLLSDSRITWKSHQRWDAGRKVFCCARHADAFAYCGDVVFPSLVLSQIVELADRDALFTGDPTPEVRHREFMTAVRASFQLRTNAPDHSFDILHVFRVNEGNRSKFSLWQLSFSKQNGKWTNRALEVSETKSSLVVALGSGSKSISGYDKRWRESDIGGTSRAIFGAFCDAVFSGDDPATGGAPQLVGIYRKGPARSIGFIRDGIKYFCGLPISSIASLDQVEWRDELFQRVDGETLQLISGAQRHSRPTKR